MKFVLRDRMDYEFARDTVVERDLAACCATVLMSPVHGVLAPETLAKWVLADGLQVRVQLQVHKYIWGADTQGV